VVNSSVYRKTKHCSTCPFLDDGKSMSLANGRVEDIKQGLLEGGSFNCHKTVYDLNEDLSPSKEEQSLKMCYGAYLFLKENGMQNQVMQVAERLLGED